MISTQVLANCIEELHNITKVDLCIYDADGIEVVSVGTSFLRFFELAETMGKPVVAVTDNDGDLESVERKYEGYRALGDKSIAPELSPAYPPKGGYRQLQLQHFRA